MAEDQTQAEVPAKGGGKLWMIIIGVNVLVLGGVGAYFLTKEDPAAAADAEEESAELGLVVPVETFIVNLNEPRHTKYLKVTFEVELTEGVSEEILNERRAVIRHKVITYLSGLTTEDVQGGDDVKNVVKEMLVQRLNEALNTEAIKELYFTEYVVQ